MHRLTSMILNIINDFHNTNFPINERDCVSPLTYYLDWFEIYYPNDLLNKYDVPFFLQCMNEIQE